MLKICDWCISKTWSDFSILQVFHFRETLHLQSFVKIKTPWKFPNLQYLDYGINEL